jgi:beta-lactam-binding protein with PASTA domain
MISKFAKIAVLCAAFLLAAVASAYLTLTFIIKSEDTVIVPDLVGKDVVSALELLTDLQLNTKVSGSEYSQEFPKNHVTFQEPEAGSEIKKDRDVRIVISKGPKNILMPNLVTLSEQQARMIIEENGLSRGQLSHTFNGTAEKDHVMAQVPQAGAMVTRGADVDILVSLGPQPVKYIMPDLDGLALDQAVFMIEKANLSVGEIRSRFDTQKPHNAILSQDPGAGYGVIANSPVQLVVNRPTDNAEADHRHRPLYGSLFQFRIKNGYIKKNVQVELEQAEETTEIFDDYIKPGDEIWLLVPRDRDATVFVFEDDELVATRMYKAW